VLGTVFNSNIFSQRSREGQIMFQVMLGGARHPDTIRKSDEELIDLAKAEIKAVLNVQGEPKEQFLSRWGKAIPQYDRSYPQAREAIDGLMVRYPGLYLLSNYLDGVSVNDCIANAKVLSEKVLQGSTEDENKVEKIFQ
jgi:oxygen-dependent protoporphyrinogen oxidase